MNIGRKPLTKEDFDKLWAQLEVQLHVLFMNQECEASHIYSVLYSICTSTITYEDSLYWNIGDFLYHRCEELKREITKSKDYIKTYAEVFERFENSINVMNSICSFLNRTTDSRNIDQLGYMLWERVIIESLPEDFYGNVYNYQILKCCYEIEKKTVESKEEKEKNVELENEIEFVQEIIKFGKESNLSNKGKIVFCNKNNEETVENDEETNKNNKRMILPSENDEEAAGKIRIKILKSLEKIEILPNCPMIYYKEKYEKKALKTMKKKYCDTRYDGDILELSKIVYSTAIKERELYKYYFLPGSNEQAEKILEECFFKENNEIINSIKKMLKQIINFDSEEKSVENKDIIDCKFIEQIENSLLNKSKKHLVLEEDVSMCMMIIQRFSVFEKGFILAKTAYAYFLIEMINSHSEMFRNGIETIYEFYMKLDVFRNDREKRNFKKKCILNKRSSILKNNINCYNNIIKNDNTYVLYNETANENSYSFYSDFEEIQICLFKHALQRIKPCFLNRLCKYSTRFVLCDKIDNYLLEIFCMMMNFVSDMKELINMYHGVLKNRLLNENFTNGKKIKNLFEIKIFENKFNNKFNNGFNNGLKKLNSGNRLNNSNGSNKNGLANNGANNNNGLNYKTLIEREKMILNAMIIPKEHKIYKMLNDIVENRPQRHGENKFTFLNKLYWGIESDNTNMKIPINLINEIKKIYGGVYEHDTYKINNAIIKFENLFSTVKISINQTICVLNLLQYTVIDAITKKHFINEIKEKTGIQDFLLNNIIRCLIGENIVIYDEMLGYYINDNIEKSEINISKVEKYNKSDSDFSVTIYLEAFLSKMMKRIKKIEYEKAVVEIKTTAIVDVDVELINSVIKSVINKGIIEVKNNILEYIS